MNKIDKHLKYLIVILVILVNSNLINSQTITFNKIYDYNSSFNFSSWAFSIQQTVDSGYILAGKVDKDYGSYTNEDLLIIKVNKHGDTLWTKNYGGSLADIAYDIQKTSDGSYIVAGVKDRQVDMVNYFMYGDLWILKLNQFGDTLWTKTYGGLYNDYANSIKQTSDGGYIVAGTKNNYKINTLGDIWILKLDQYGDTIWTKTFHFSNYLSEANTIYETNQGSYYLAGSASIGGPIQNILALKLQSNGDTIWCKKLNGYVGNDIIQIEDSNLIIAGRSNTEGLIYKLDSNGNLNWVRSYPSHQGFRFQINSLTTDTSNNIVLIGEKTDFNDVVNLPMDLWIQKLSPNGDSLWAKYYDFSMRDQGSNVKITNDSGLIVTGRSNDYAWLFKLNENGELLNELHKDLNNDCFSYVFPNPFINNSNIYYKFPEYTYKKVELNIYNYLGCKIKSYSFNTNNKGIFLFDRDGMTSGIYFYELKYANYKVSNKFIIE